MAEGIVRNGVGERRLGVDWLWTGGHLVLRLPGLLLLELRLRSTSSLHLPSWAENSDKKTFSAFIMDFVLARHFDEFAGKVLSCSTLFLCVLFLGLPVRRLVSLYLHALSAFFLALGHFGSMRYVEMEQELGGAASLDSLAQLERHGYQFAAQVVLALATSCLLGVENQLVRMALAVYALPIVGRLCGFPLELLPLLHNFACSLVLSMATLFLLNSTPWLLLWLRRLYKQVKAYLVVRGPVGGAVAWWRRRQFHELLCLLWATLCSASLYGKWKTEDEQLGLLLLSSLAESAATPLSLLALAAAVSACASLILWAAKWWLGDAEGVPGLDQEGYTQGFTLLLLCFQTDLLAMTQTQKSFVLALVLFIVASCLLQALLSILEPHLLSLGAGGGMRRSAHLRALLLSGLLFVGPLLLVWGICALLPLDLWLLIIASNCALTSLQTLSGTAVYLLFLAEARASGPWEHLDDYIFGCRAVIRGLEMALAVLVVVYGLHESLNGHWSWFSAGILLLHSYFIVWTRLQAGWRSFQQRRAASAQIALLAAASRSQLDSLRDVCAICFTEMREARVTPCGHFFHAGCLKKWLFVRLSCPMCHADLQLTGKRRRRRPAALNEDSEEGYSTEEQSDSDSDTQPDTSDSD